jgi:hypothetical protein
MSTTTEPTSSTSGTRDTAPCRKCTTDIPTAADRCPQCGHEPGPGILAGIVMWVSGMLASVFLTIAVVSLFIIATGFPILDGLTVAAFTGGIGAFFGSIVYSGYRSGQRGPTDPPVGSDIEDTVESWDGEAAGEAAADRINSLGPAVVEALPAWMWTAGVLLGIALHLSLWVATLQESEIGMGVGLLGGMIVSFVAIVSDTHRVKWTTEYAPRWWLWTVPAMIPLFGWIIGLAWLLRKRQKTGSVV